MQFGVFDHLDRGDLPLRDIYESRLQLLEAYDQPAFTPATSPSTIRHRSAWRHPPAFIEYEIQTADTKLRVQRTSETLYKPNAKATLRLPPDRCTIINNE